MRSENGDKKTLSLVLGTLVFLAISTGTPFSVHASSVVDLMRIGLDVWDNYDGTKDQTTTDTQEGRDERTRSRRENVDVMFRKVNDFLSEHEGSSLSNPETSAGTTGEIMQNAQASGLPINNPVLREYLGSAHWDETAIRALAGHLGQAPGRMSEGLDRNDRSMAKATMVAAMYVLDHPEVLESYHSSEARRVVGDLHDAVQSLGGNFMRFEFREYVSWERAKQMIARGEKDGLSDEEKSELILLLLESGDNGEAVLRKMGGGRPVAEPDTASGGGRDDNQASTMPLPGEWKVPTSIAKILEHNSTSASLTENQQRHLARYDRYMADARSPEMADRFRKEKEIFLKNISLTAEYEKTRANIQGAGGPETAVRLRLLEVARETRGVELQLELDQAKYGEDHVYSKQTEARLRNKQAQFQHELARYTIAVSGEDQQTQQIKRAIVGAQYYVSIYLIEAQADPQNDIRAKLAKAQADLTAAEGALELLGDRQKKEQNWGKQIAKQALHVASLQQSLNGTLSLSAKFRLEKENVKAKNKLANMEYDKTIALNEMDKKIYSAVGDDWRVQRTQSTIDRAHERKEQTSNGEEAQLRRITEKETRELARETLNKEVTRIENLSKQYSNRFEAAIVRARATPRDSTRPYEDELAIVQLEGKRDEMHWKASLARAEAYKKYYTAIGDTDQLQRMENSIKQSEEHLNASVARTNDHVARYRAIIASQRGDEDDTSEDTDTTQSDTASDNTSGSGGAIYVTNDTAGSPANQGDLAQVAVLPVIENHGGPAVLDDQPVYVHQGSTGDGDDVASDATPVVDRLAALARTRRLGSGKKVDVQGPEDKPTGFTYKRPEGEIAVRSQIIYGGGDTPKSYIEEIQDDSGNTLRTEYVAGIELNDAGQEISSQRMVRQTDPVTGLESSTLTVVKEGNVESSVKKYQKLGANGEILEVERTGMEFGDQKDSEGNPLPTDYVEVIKDQAGREMGTVNRTGIVYDEKGEPKDYQELVRNKDPEGGNETRTLRTVKDGQEESSATTHHDKDGKEIGTAETTKDVRSQKDQAALQTLRQINKQIKDASASPGSMKKIAHKKFKEGMGKLMEQFAKIDRMQQQTAQRIEKNEALQKKQPLEGQEQRREEEKPGLQPGR